jgi:hypothetical protein
MQQLDEVPEGYEPVTDPTEVPEEIRKKVGVAGVRALLGMTTGTGASGKAMPEWADKKYSPQIETYGGLSTALNTFKDDFGGNTLTGGLENTIQGAWGGFGSEGQRDWWAQFKSNDNQIRNKLFGSALTETEKAAYESTTVSPSMDPAEIRRNLASRKAIVQKALQRTTKFLKAQGYNPDSISALAGEYAPELGAIDDEPKEGGDPASTAAGAADGSGTPPPGPDGRTAPPGTELKFNDEIPPEISNAVHLTDEQKATIARVAQSGASAEEIRGVYQGMDLPGPSVEQLAPIVAFYADPAKRGVAPIVGDVDNSIKPVDSGQGAGAAFAEGVASWIPFSTEAGAIVDTVRNGDTYDKNLDIRRGERLFNQQEHGFAREAGAFVGSLPIGGMQFAGAKAAARAAGVAAIRSGVGRGAAELAAARVFASRTAVESAAISGAYGFGNAEGDLGDRLGKGALDAGVGAVAGGALAYGGSRLASRLGNRAAAVPALTDQQDALQAAERQDIIPFPADMGGGATRRLTGAVSQTMAGAGPIRAGAEATLASAEAVRNRVAASIGPATNNAEAIGETARTGARAFIARTGQRIGRIYDAAAATAGRATVDTPEARRVLDQELAPLLESPVRGPGVGILQGLRDALDQPQTVRGLREARTQIREQFENAGLRGSNLERVAGRVVDAATDDLVNGLRAQGLDRAATQYRVADRMWRERLATIDDHLTPIIGDAGGPGMKSGEQIVTGLKSAMAGNNRRFAGFIQALPPNEQAMVRASLIQRLGMATKGQQDQGGEVFSLATFLTNWNDIGARAKDTLFGAEGRAALNDLATYANQAKQSQKFANHSNTGGAMANLSAIYNFTTLGTTLVAENLGGRLLASPRFARWLARPPRVANPVAAQAHIARLSRIARAEPAIANDVLALQTRLADAFGGTSTRLAAEEGNPKADVIDRQRGEDDRQQGGTQP